MKKQNVFLNNRFLEKIQYFEYKLKKNIVKLHII